MPYQATMDSYTRERSVDTRFYHLWQTIRNDQERYLHTDHMESCYFCIKILGTMYWQHVHPQLFTKPSMTNTQNSNLLWKCAHIWWKSTRTHALAFILQHVSPCTLKVVFQQFITSFVCHISVNYSFSISDFHTHGQSMMLNCWFRRLTSPYPNFPHISSNLPATMSLYSLLSYNILISPHV
jgi:hypothetical protein